MTAKPDAEPSVISAHGNGCESCCYSRNPQGGHCYMFKEEPEVCFQHKYDHHLVEQTIDAVGGSLQ